MTTLTIQIDEGLSLSVEYDRYVFDRHEYRWSVRADNKAYEGTDLRSGCVPIDKPAPLADMLRSLLSFAAACTESGEDGENSDLFPAELREVFVAYSDELGMAQLELMGDF